MRRLILLYVLYSIRDLPPSYTLSAVLYYYTYYTLSGDLPPSVFTSLILHNTYTMVCHVLLIPGPAAVRPCAHLALLPVLVPRPLQGKYTLTLVYNTQCNTYLLPLLVPRALQAAADVWLRVPHRRLACRLPDAPLRRCGGPKMAGLAADCRYVKYYIV